MLFVAQGLINLAYKDKLNFHHREHRGHRGKRFEIRNLKSQLRHFKFLILPLCPLCSLWLISSFLTLGLYHLLKRADNQTSRDERTSAANCFLEQFYTSRGSPAAGGRKPYGCFRDSSRGRGRWSGQESSSPGRHLLRRWCARGRVRSSGPSIGFQVNSGHSRSPVLKRRTNRTGPARRHLLLLAQSVCARRD